MGRRIAWWLDFFRFLRTTEPKYSLEVAIFNVTLGLACIVFSILGEHRLWAITFAVLCFSIGIQYFRLQRVLKRHLLAEREWLEWANALYEQAMHAAAHKQEPDAATDESARLLRDEIERAAATGEEE